MTRDMHARSCTDEYLRKAFRENGVCCLTTVDVMAETIVQELGKRNVRALVREIEAALQE